MLCQSCSVHRSFGEPKPIATTPPFSPQSDHTSSSISVSIGLSTTNALRFYLYGDFAVTASNSYSDGLRDKHMNVA